MELCMSYVSILTTGAAKVEQEQGKKEKEDQAKKEEAKKVTRCVSCEPCKEGYCHLGA